VREAFTRFAYAPIVAKRTHRLAQAAYALHTALEAELHDTLKALDLTMPLADALWHLDPAREPMSRRALAERLRCDPSNVTYLVDRLEQRRLLTRARDGGDRRVSALTLTQAGTHARGRLLTTLAQSPLFSDLTRAEQRQLADLLQRCAGPD
jgi:DNA-binding MarR family transcriptional regulator